MGGRAFLQSVGVLNQDAMKTAFWRIGRKADCPRGQSAATGKIQVAWTWGTMMSSKPKTGFRTLAHRDASSRAGAAQQEAPTHNVGTNWGTHARTAVQGTPKNGRLLGPGNRGGVPWQRGNMKSGLRGFITPGSCCTGE